MASDVAASADRRSAWAKARQALLVLLTTLFYLAIFWPMLRSIGAVLRRLGG